MSEHDVELHRRWIDAFNARDIEAQISYLDPSIEYHSTFAAADGSVYRGRDGFRRWHRARWEVWAELRTEPEAHLTSASRYSCSPVSTGVDGAAAWKSMSMAQISRWREGRMVSAKGYADRKDALRYLGVAEDDLGRGLIREVDER